MSRMRLKIRSCPTWVGSLAIVLAAGVGLGTGVRAASLPLQSHLAVYELSLQRSRDGSGITDLSGRLVMEWAQDCEGYILNQRMLTEVSNTQGENVLNDFNVTTWESLDGHKFRFSSRNDVAGSSADEVVGRASMPTSGAAGEARFSKPEETTLALPTGTVFPTEQIALVLQAAMKGEKTLSILLFDGSRKDSLFDTSNIIGAEQPTLTVADAGERKMLVGLRSWPVHTAYYPRSPAEDLPPGVPEFEVSYRLFQNGVATEVVFDYGSFAMRARLSKLQALPKPAC
jgi:EipB-like